MKVYLAGPIGGQTFGACTGWRDEVKEILSQRTNDKIVGYSPMRNKAYLSVEDKMKDSYSDYVMSSVNGINVRDYNDCKTSAAIFVNFLGCGTKVSIGTVMEIAWGRAFQIPVVIVMDENNVHKHSMLTFGNIVVNSVEEGVDVITQLLLP